MATGDPINYSDVAQRVASTPLTSNSATWTSSESGALISVTASLVNGWTYRVWATMKVFSTVAADVAFMRLREDNTTGTQDDGVNVYIPTTSANGWLAYLYTEYTAAATGSKTFLVTGSRLTGTGTQNIAAGAARPAFLTVDRLVS